MLEPLIVRLQPHSHRRLLWVVGGLLLAIWGFVIAWSLAERNNALKANALVMEQLGAAVESQTRSLFKQAETSFMVAGHWMATHPDQDPTKAPDFIKLAQVLSEQSGGMLNLRLASHDGKLRLLPDKGDTDNIVITDRAFFKVQQDPQTRGFYIGKPVKSRLTGRWGIPLSMPVTKSGGDVSVMLLTIEYARIANIFEAERMKPLGTIGIAAMDGEILFRSPVDERSVGKSLANGSGWDLIQRQPLKGAYESGTGMIDGMTRLASYVHVEGYPLLVYVSESKAHVLAGWRNHTLMLTLVASLLSIFGVAMGLALLRALHNARVAEAIVHSADEAIVGKSLDGIITSWNRGAERIFGYTSQEMVGQPVLRLIPPELAHEENRILDQLRHGHAVEHLETVRLRKDGRRINVSLTTSPIRDGMGRLVGASKILRDITAEKAAEAQLKLTASVFTNTSEGILIADRRGLVVEVNEAFGAITGYSREEVLGQNPNAFRSSRQGPDVFKQLRRTLRHAPEWRGEFWSRKKDGSAYSAWLTVTKLLDANGEVSNYVALFSDITALKQHQERLEHSAHFDPLTDLPNRLLLSDRLQQAMTQCQRHKQSLAVLYLDLDGFKRINDLYGHRAGDDLLVAVSRRMKAALREVDTLARMGGDEFVAVLIDVASTLDCIQFVKRVLAACAEPVLINDQELSLTASIGVTIYPQDNAEADQLMRHADQAMYEAKQSGKNRFHMFDSAQDAEVKSRGAAQDGVARGLANNEFVLFYQPKVNMRTGDVMGVEALIRWQHPQRGLLPPAEFLPVIEHHVLIENLGIWVLEHALAQMRHWHALGLELQVSVNIAARHLQHNDFAKVLSDILQRYPDVDPSHLELEVLETSALDNIAATTKVLQDCHALGVRFAIDDFGTGYSSLTYLRHLPVETLKIDQSFVRDMLDDANDLSIVRGVIGLASAFHRTVVAEGVETVAHGQHLIALGCELAQGYAIARPMPAERIADWCYAWTPPLEWTNAGQRGNTLAI